MADGKLILTAEEMLLIWEKALEVLKRNLTPAAFKTWIEPVVPGAERNSLVLFCPNTFCLDWLESRYKSIILETVQSIEPSIEEIVLREEGQVNDHKRQLVLKVDEDLYDLMKQVYEKEKNNSIGRTFEEYFTQILQSVCQERMDAG